MRDIVSVWGSDKEITFLPHKPGILYDEHTPLSLCLETHPSLPGVVCGVA